MVLQSLQSYWGLLYPLMYGLVQSTDTATSVDDFEIGEVSLLHLIYDCGLVVESLTAYMTIKIGFEIKPKY